MHNLESIWAIRPEATPTVVRMLAGTAGPNPQQDAPTHTDGKVAVIPIRGVLTNGGPASYGSNYQTIASAVEKSAADPSVKRIVLSVDSPGGEITGLPEAAAAIAAAAKVKPVSAIVEGQAASAAYWLASQASDITLTPSGEVGSVGVRSMHVDVSKMLEAEGLTVTEMYSGDHKTEWSPYKPLADDAKAEGQARVEAAHKEFLAAVAQGRGSRVSQSMTKARYGEGRMHKAADALRHGLVDNIQATRDFYRAAAPAPSAPAQTGFGSPRRARLELERLKV